MDKIIKSCFDNKIAAFSGTDWLKSGWSYEKSYFSACGGFGLSNWSCQVLVAGSHPPPPPLLVKQMWAKLDKHNHGFPLKEKKHNPRRLEFLFIFKRDRKGIDLYGYASIGSAAFHDWNETLKLSSPMKAEVVNCKGRNKNWWIRRVNSSFTLSGMCSTCPFFLEFKEVI